MKFSSAEDAQRFAFDAIGTDFLTKALHRNRCIVDARFDKAWRSLRAGDPILTGPTQLQGPVSRPRDFSWELLLASLVATFATNVRMAEPDVVCEFQGKRVGLAAKVFYGSNDGQLLDKIQEGARQIQNQNVDQGFVVVNMVEQFPHERLFNVIREAGIAEAKVIFELVSGWVDAFLVAHPVPFWEQHLRGMSKLMSVMMFVPTILPLAGMPMPLPYYRIHTFGLIGREDEALLFEQALQLACEEVPAFYLPPPVESGDVACRIPRFRTNI